MRAVAGIADDQQRIAAGDHERVVAGGLRFEGYADLPPARVAGSAGPPAGHGQVLAHGGTRRWVRPRHDPGHDPDEIDPTNQSGRPVMVTGAVVGIILALALMAVVYFIAR